MQAESHSDTTTPRPKRRKINDFSAPPPSPHELLCGIGYDDMIPVRNPEPYFPPAFCVPVATNLSKASRVPRTDLMEKAKEFLDTDEDPKWYYIVRV